MPFSNNKKPSRKPKILPQFYVHSGGKPPLDLLEIQRQSFFAFLENGIVQELSKIEKFHETAKTSAFTRELELVLKPESYRLISPNCTPKQAISKGKYVCLQAICTSHPYSSIKTTKGTVNKVNREHEKIGTRL